MTVEELVEGIRKGAVDPGARPFSIANASEEEPEEHAAPAPVALWPVAWNPPIDRSDRVARMLARLQDVLKRTW